MKKLLAVAIAACLGAPLLAQTQAPRPAPSPAPYSADYYYGPYGQTQIRPGKGYSKMKRKSDDGVVPTYNKRPGVKKKNVVAPPVKPNPLDAKP